MDTNFSGLLPILILCGFAVSYCGSHVEKEPSELSGRESILRHSTNLYTSIAFHVGMELEIFTVLDSRPMSVSEAAVVTKIRPLFLERLLYSLVASDLLTVEEGVFANTPEASRFLVEGKPDYLGEHVLVNPHLKQWIFQAGAETADSLIGGHGSIDYDFYEESTHDELAAVFRGTMAVAVKAGVELANRYHFQDQSSVADIGGASGGLALSIKRAYPGLELTVTDLPSVTPVTRTLLDEQGDTDIQILEWDVLEGPCSRTFDVAILRALIQVLTPEQAKTALVNISGSINPGGTIYVLGHTMDDSKTSPPEEVVWFLINLNWEDEAGFYTEGDLREMLQNAGFSAIESATLSNGDRVICARKKF